MSVNSDTKRFPTLPTFLCKLSWDFYKKCDDESILNLWKMAFQASDFKERQFLELLDDELNFLKPSARNSGPWLQYFDHFNSLCTRATRAIINHAPTSKYQLRFFPKEGFTCSCELYPIESRWHILYKCNRFNSYWNPRRDTIAYFTLFLEFNNNIFFFGEGYFIPSHL